MLIPVEKCLKWRVFCDIIWTMKKTKRGMVREDKSDKLNYLSYFTPYTLERYARHMKRGELTHGRSNWKKGSYPQDEYLESAMRHLLALWEGTPVDEDHAAAVVFNMMGYMHEEYLDGDFD